MICCGRCISRCESCKPPACAAKHALAVLPRSGGAAEPRCGAGVPQATIKFAGHAGRNLETTWRIEHGQPAALRTCVLGGGADRRRRWLWRRCGFCHGGRPAAVLGVHRAVRDLADCRVDATRLNGRALPQPRKTLAAKPEDAGEISEHAARRRCQTTPPLLCWRGAALLGGSLPAVSRSARNLAVCALAPNRSDPMSSAADVEQPIAERARGFAP